MLKMLRRIKNFVKSIPFVGKSITNLYRNFLFLKPAGQYWQYNFKAMQFGKLIRKLVSMIGDKEYKVIVSGDGNTQILLKNDIKFGWTPRDPSSLLGVPLQGNFETECTFLVSRLIKAGDIVFDVGANFGWYSCHFAQLVGETGKVHIFEPTNTMEELKNNLILNGFAKRCVLNQVALGEKEGVETLFIPHKLGTAFASLREHTYGNNNKNYKISVPIKKLDDYVIANKIEKIDFIKIDVEGAELLVLKGAENILKNYSPVIMMELYSDHTKYFGYSPEEVINYMIDFDYHIYEIDKTEIGFMNKVNSFRNTSNYNFLAMKNDDILEKNSILIR